jgi:uncharacterized protein YecT (DUF1311 family)
LDKVNDVAKWLSTAIALCCFAISDRAMGQSMNAPGGPCGEAGSTMDTAKCFDRAYKEADSKLNKTYERIKKVLQGDEITDLTMAQRLWIQYRDATCKAEYDLFSGGSGGPPTRLACLEAEARAREVSLLRSYGFRLEKFEK